MSKENNKLPPSSKSSNKLHRNFYSEAMRGPIICIYPASPEVAPIVYEERILRNLRSIRNPGEQASELEELIKRVEKKVEDMRNLYKNNYIEYCRKYYPSDLET